MISQLLNSKYEVSVSSFGINMINILTKSCNLYMLSKNKNGKALLQCCCLFKLIDMITLLCIERCPGTPFKCLSECR
jgi:hypothetical protein